MDNQESKYPPPFSLRLTFEEREQLDRESGNAPLGAYIREKLFDTPSPRKRSFRQPLKDEQALAQLLSDLGRSHIANNLNQLAKASNSGSLPITPETETAIQEACRDVQMMRQHLIQVLGLKS